MYSYSSTGKVYLHTGKAWSAKNLQRRTFRVAETGFLQVRRHSCRSTNSVQGTESIKLYNIIRMKLPHVNNWKIQYQALIIHEKYLIKC